MSSWWVQRLLESGGYVLLFSWAFWVILSICLHELAHGWAAIEQGDDTPIVLGHMNLNPLVHMGRFSLLMFAIVGVAWGLMPVNPSRFRDGRLGDAKVAAAGPAMNLLLALVALTALGILWGLVWRSTSPPGDFAQNLHTFLWTGGMLNLVLMGLNLLPILPLDGSRIAAALSPSVDRLYHHQAAGPVSLACFILTFVVFSDYAFKAAGAAAEWWARLIASTLS